MSVTRLEATEAASYSDRGPFRQRNEDCALAACDDGVFVVADGVGGCAGGDRASRVAVNAVVRVLDGESSFEDETGRALGGAAGGLLRGALADLGDTFEARLRRAFLVAHWRIVEDGRRTGLVRMATAMVAAHMVNGHAWIAHVGDCRAYALADGRLCLLTEDHSLAASLERMGGLPEGARRSPFLRNRLTQVVGGSTIAEADVRSWRPSPGARLLLCTDGVWAAMNRAHVADCLATAPSACVASRSLVETALAAGGRDNATALVVFFDR